MLPEDAREYSRSLEALPDTEQDFLLPRTLLSALQRFATTGSIQAVSDTIKESCEIGADRLDSELSMVRYIAWAIPSIGFIGTVRGIGEALGQAYKAVEGDITGVTVSLGVAFNSTFVALVLSIVIMFCLHQLQLSQERLVLDCQRYADKRLLRHLVLCMSVALLDINDCNLQLWGADSAVQSPGYALLEGKEYRFGTAARSSARLRPRDINNRFWWQLNTEPLQPALGPARHTADLVHAHLQQVHREAGQPEELLLACSGSMQREQLSLLLGIAQQCPFDAVGLVNRSALLGSLLGGRGRLFHLELQLHQALLTCSRTVATKSACNAVCRCRAAACCSYRSAWWKLPPAHLFARPALTRGARPAQSKASTMRCRRHCSRWHRKPETNIEVNGYRARVSAADMAAAGQRLFTAAPEAMGAMRADDRIVADPLVALAAGPAGQFSQLTWRMPTRCGCSAAARRPPGQSRRPCQFRHPPPALVWR